MSNQVPLRLAISPLPPNFVGTPQDICDAIEARATILTDQAFSLFVVGPTAPTTNEGPFFKNGLTPYGWSDISGSYIPMSLDQKSLRYGVFQTGAFPSNNTDYDVVFGVDPSSTPVGSPASVNLWYNGAWTEFPWLTPTSLPTSFPWLTQAALNAAYYQKTTDNTAILSINRYPFKAITTIADVEQIITAGAAISQIAFSSVEFQSGTAFSANIFTAPVAGYYHFTSSVNLGVKTGSPSAPVISMYLRRNYATLDAVDQFSTDVGSAHTYNLGADVVLAAGDVVDCAVEIATTGASTWYVGRDPRRSFFSGFLIQSS